MKDKATLSGFDFMRNCAIYLKPLQFFGNQPVILTGGAVPFVFVAVKYMIKFQVMVSVLEFECKSFTVSKGQRVDMPYRIFFPPQTTTFFRFLTETKTYCVLNYLLTCCRKATKC